MSLTRASRWPAQALLAALLLCLSSGSASAWDVSIGMNFLDSGLYVESWSGPGYNWTTLDERVRASDQPGPTVPIIWTTQTWDALAGEWPTADLLVSEGVTDASLYNDDPTNEFWTSAEAFVFGSVATGDAVGAAVAYDFELEILPFTTANLLLDPFETHVYLESQAGDVGNAFAAFRLYLPDVDVNAPGGANDPLASDDYSLAAGGTLIDATPTFSAVFDNPTGVSETYHLRLEFDASVFAAPEPGAAAGLAVGVMALAGLRTRRRPVGRRAAP